MKTLLTSLLIALPFDLLHADAACEDALAVRHPMVYRLERDNRTSRLMVVAPAGVALKNMPAEVHQMLDRATDLVVRDKEPGTLTNAISLGLTLKRSVRMRQPPLSTQLTLAQWMALRAKIGKIRSVERLVKFTDRLTVTAAIAFINPLMPRLEELNAAGKMKEELLARFRGKRVHAMQSYLTQERIFHRAATIETLHQLLDSTEDYDVDEYLRNYRAGDERALVKMREFEQSQAPGLWDATVTNLTQAWLPKLIRVHQTPGEHLFAFSVDHALGAGGILELMRGAGFTVVRENAGAAPSP